MPHNLLITCGHLIRHYPKFKAEIEGHGITASLPHIAGQQLDAPEMREAIRDQHLVIAGDDFIDRSVLEAGRAGGLRAIVKWGIGTDGIDKEAARELGIPIYNTPGAFSEEVGDVAAGYLVLLARGLHRMHAAMREGKWLKVEGMTLAGRTAGVVGLGSIGRAVARRCSAFGMRTIGYDPMAIAKELLAAEKVTQVRLDTLLAEADFVIVACALTPESFHLISEKAIARMKDGVRVINVARGPVVDEPALIAGLQSGKIAAAALDVFETEPLPADSPLRAFDNVIFGTHNGSNTTEAVARVNRLTVDLALDLFGLTGQPPRIAPLVPA
jgi:D-3-phosphoglycerate dehydrogenase